MHTDFGLSWGKPCSKDFSQMLKSGQTPIVQVYADIIIVPPRHPCYLLHLRVHSLQTSPLVQKLLCQSSVLRQKRCCPQSVVVRHPPSASSDRPFQHIWSSIDP